MTADDMKNTIKYNQLRRQLAEVESGEASVAPDQFNDHLERLDQLDKEISELFEKLPALPHTDELVDEFGSDVSAWPATDERVIANVMAQGARDGFFPEMVREIFGEK